jgi:hypothetical protein
MDGTFQLLIEKKRRGETTNGEVKIFLSSADLESRIPRDTDASFFLVLRVK